MTAGEHEKREARGDSTKRHGMRKRIDCQIMTKQKSTKSQKIKYASQD
jgi:hypothetical protein